MFKYTSKRYNSVCNDRKLTLQFTFAIVPEPKKQFFGDLRIYAGPSLNEHIILYSKDFKYFCFNEWCQIYMNQAYKKIWTTDDDL